MSLLSRFNPLPGIKDFWSEFSRPQPHRVPILFASIAIPAAAFYFLIPESEYVAPRAPDVTYITSFAPDRTDEEIAASNIANQERQDALAAQREAIEQRKKELYRALGRASGMDVDEIEREAAAERAREDSGDEGEPSGTQGETGANPTE